MMTTSSTYFFIYYYYCVLMMMKYGEFTLVHHLLLIICWYQIEYLLHFLFLLPLPLILLLLLHYYPSLFVTMETIRKPSVNDELLITLVNEQNKIHCVILKMFTILYQIVECSLFSLNIILDVNL